MIKDLLPPVLLSVNIEKPRIVSCRKFYTAIVEKADSVCGHLSATSLVLPTRFKQSSKVAPALGPTRAGLVSGKLFYDRLAQKKEVGTNYVFPRAQLATSDALWALNSVHIMGMKRDSIIRVHVIAIGIAPGDHLPLPLEAVRMWCGLIVIDRGK